MRHHRFHPAPDVRPPRRHRPAPPGGEPCLPAATHHAAVPPALPAPARELRELVAWLRQRLAGRHTVRASVITAEPAGPGTWMLLLGEADPDGGNDPPRVKARLNAPELAAIRAERGADFDPAALINRTVTVTLCTALRRRFGRGAGVEARVITLQAVDDITVDAALVRAETLRRLRAERLRFGPETWREPGDVREIALVASEHGDARRDVEHVLGPLEAAGVLRVHRVWAAFEGAGAERALTAALGRVAVLHTERGLSATLVVRGGGPLAAFAPLDAHAVARAATAGWVPNLIVGLGHAGTPATALDRVAARSEPTPTAAAGVIRDLVLGAGERARRALADHDAAVADELATAGRIALSRAVGAFEAALRDLTELAERRLRQVDLGVEQALLRAAMGVSATPTPFLDEPYEEDGCDATAERDVDALLAAGLALALCPATGNVVTGVEGARRAGRLLLRFPDGILPVLVEADAPTIRSH